MMEQGLEKIECSTEGNSDDNPDNLMIIIWCVSVEVRLLWTNLDNNKYF